MAEAIAIFHPTASVLFSDGGLKEAAAFLDDEGDECEAEDASYVVVLAGTDALIVELDDLELLHLN
jgi:hypothetical protein